MKRSVLSAGVTVMATVAVLTTACGIQPSAVIHGVSAPTEELQSVVLFFMDGDTLTRVIRPWGDPPLDNLALLGEGPTRMEQHEGLTTEIPAAAAPITMSNGETATVTISSPVAELSDNAKDQIICTAVPPWQDPPVPVVITGTDQSTPARKCPFRA